MKKAAVVKVKPEPSFDSFPSYNNEPEETQGFDRSPSKPDVMSPKPYTFDYELSWKRMCLLYPIVYGANCGTPTLIYTPGDSITSGFAIRGRSDNLIGKGATIESAIRSAYQCLRVQVEDMQRTRQNQINEWQVALDGKIE